ncbi:MAG: DUF882 domain-containing protein [Proteobacteria bacterium]|nr:DUF882 domain-containing protein [Pseudomonadota bacterium]
MATEPIRTTPAFSLSRRKILACGVAAALLARVSPAAARAAAPARHLFVANPHTGESFNGAYWAEGGYIPGALARLDHILRDHRTDQVHPINPALFDVLARLRRELDISSPLHVICGYRSAESNAAARLQDHRVAPNSLHIEGKAVDIRVPGYSLVGVRRAAVALKAGGVGLYPRANYLHLDIGPVRTW